MLKGYLFSINGEPSFVETYDLESAFGILAEEGFDFISDEVIYTGATYTPEEAEEIGYDTF